MALVWRQKKGGLLIQRPNTSANIKQHNSAAAQQPHRTTAREQRFSKLAHTKVYHALDNNTSATLSSEEAPLVVIPAPLTTFSRRLDFRSLVLGSCVRRPGRDVQPRAMILRIEHHNLQVDGERVLGAIHDSHTLHAEGGVLPSLVLVADDGVGVGGGLVGRCYGHV